MPSQITWNEIRDRAIEFISNWKDETDEKAEAQTFWNDFFHIFGLTRKRLAVFEKHVRKLGDKQGNIDLFWKGTLIVEHKSKGKNLDKAFDQAIDYFQGLDENELPRYVIVTDFQRFRLEDLEDNKTYDFNINELKDKIHLFGFMLGHTKKIYKDEDPVNIKAAELMGSLHDALKDNGYTGHPLEELLVRLMFCLFADDTGIFEKDQFVFYLEEKTREDGSDVGAHLASIFQILNTPDENRQKNLDEDLAKFPYVNGDLFFEPLPIPSFDTTTRKILLSCCYFDWSRVSPAIFGSLFQSVMDPIARRDIGAHYTSEKNILKTIKPLFLDDLIKEYESHKKNTKYLQEMLERISKMKFLDPACGCGNFLIISYRELRRLQIEIHKQLRKTGKFTQLVIDIETYNKDLNVDAMYGIEILEFPVRIAEVALWLVDHQMNIELSDAIGIRYTRLPLKTSPHIINTNALRINWETIVSKTALTIILGNPPYIGKHLRTKEMNEDMDLVFGEKIDSYGNLDYVANWYLKAQEYIKDTKIKVGFVSTNSITQGEQVGILWNYLLDEKIIINFAHRTFDWSNNAKFNANVYVVIIGFSYEDNDNKFLYDYDSPNAEPMEIKVKHINPYLIEFKDLIITRRTDPMCDVPPMVKGSQPTDHGHLIFTDEEKKEFLIKEPNAEKYIKPLISAWEYLHGEKRWCLWLTDITPNELNKLPLTLDRVEEVRNFRLKSKKLITRKLAEVPYLFAEIRQPNSEYILIPRHSSEFRKYIPMVFLSKDNIVSDSCSAIPDATLYHFGILMSSMHMAWTKQVCGRLESRYRYSNTIVYNNFPWPETPNKEKIDKIENLVKDLIKLRKKYYDTPLGDLYDPLLMPKDILELHKKIDITVEKCYRAKAFKTDLERLIFLFGVYQNYDSAKKATEI